MIDKVVDWPSVVDDIRRAGVSMYQAQALVGISRSQLCEYGAGTCSPTHAGGERVIALWCSLTGRTREALPMTRPVLSAARMT